MIAGDLSVGLSVGVWRPTPSACGGFTPLSSPSKAGASFGTRAGRGSPDPARVPDRTSLSFRACFEVGCTWRFGLIVIGGVQSLVHPSVVVYPASCPCGFPFPNSSVPGFAEDTHPIATKDFRDLLWRIATTYHFGAHVFEVGDALKTIDIFNSRRLLVHHFWRKLE
jgi:hypothetical protein